jgi:hypothetical protein
MARVIPWTWFKVEIESPVRMRAHRTYDNSSRGLWWLPPKPALPDGFPLARGTAVDHNVELETLGSTRMSAENASLVGLIIAGAGAVGGFIGYWWSRRTLRTQTLHYLLTEYRSVEMFEAVKVLHRFMDECVHGGESPRCRYEARVRDDNKRFETASDSEKGNILKHTIENQRRTVSQYYSIMLRALDDKILRPKDVFGYWSAGAIYIIPKAIQPIGQDDDKGLQWLYQKALAYEKRKGNPL